MVNPSDGRWTILINRGATNGTIVSNNIILNQHAWRGSIGVDDMTNFRSDYNILNDKLGIEGDASTISFQAWQTLGLGVHTQVVAGLGNLFVNPALMNYQLQLSAIAIDNGTTEFNDLIFKDLRGICRPRGDGVDLGCYEY